MKVAISSEGENLESQLDPRFGRCQFFIFIDTDSMDFEAILNESADAMGGAGIAAAQNVVNKKAEAVLTGNLGPNAFQTLSAAGIRIITGVSGSVNDVINKFKNGELKESASPNVASHFGMGGNSSGGGQGHGGGHGKRGGGGMGKGQSQGRGRGQHKGIRKLD